MLFAPFFTTKPEGLGLGLNICRTTVESHRGRLEFENRPEGGATFTVYLPITP
jgi:signal transduction histidine kinase